MPANILIKHLRGREEAGDSRAARVFIALQTLQGDRDHQILACHFRCRLIGDAYRHLNDPLVDAIGIDAFSHDNCALCDRSRVETAVFHKFERSGFLNSINE